MYLTVWSAHGADVTGYHEEKSWLLNKEQPKLLLEGLYQKQILVD